MPKTITLAIELSLEEEDVRTLCSAIPGDAPSPIKVGRICLSLAKDLVAGGLMLPAESVRRIKKAIQSVDSEAIVSKVESTAGRFGDHFLQPVAIDPVWEPRLREIAAVRGCPMDQILQEVVATVIKENWLWDNVVPPEPPPVNFSRSDYESVRNTVSAGGAVFGEDIAAWVRGHTEVARNAAVRG